MALLDESNKAVESAATIGAGIPPNDPMAMEALAGLERSRTSYGSMGKSALMGAGMGAKAGEGAMNPLTAFLQGAAAGLQAPAQVFAQKQEQIKTTLDSIPFGVRFPELASQPAYRALAGMPSAIALETVQGIARDTAKVYAEGIEAKKIKESEYETEYIQEGQDASNAAKLLQEADGKPRTAKSLVGFRRQDLKDLISVKTGGAAPTIGSVAADRAFAREYAEYLGAGGYADTQNNIKSLEDAKEQLRAGGQYTGFFTNLFSGSVVNPKAKALQQQIETSIQRSLRQTLGAQFTEKEGALFMQRGFDPKLSEAQNIKKLDRMIDQLKIMDIAKREAINYFEENGTLAGYKGRYFTINNGQIVPANLPGPEAGKMGLTPEEEKELIELEKKGVK